MQLAQPQSNDSCLDLGAGTGFLSIPLAGRSASVLAVDLSPEMLQTLDSAAQRAGQKVVTQAADISQLRLRPACVDVIVSSYAMHYLADVDKHAVLGRAREWLTPGGRLVIADMMVGRKLDAHHRQVFWEKAVTMLRRGPAGWWRLVVNVLRLGSGRGRLRPCPPQWWVAAMTAAGFVDVAYEHVVSEAGIVVGRSDHRDGWDTSAVSAMPVVSSA
jgi:SAM-dependent methyltransferase